MHPSNGSLLVSFRERSSPLGEKEAALARSTSRATTCTYEQANDPAAGALFEIIVVVVVVVVVVVALSTYVD